MAVMSNDIIVWPSDVLTMCPSIIDMLSDQIPDSGRDISWLVSNNCVNKFNSGAF